MADEMDYQFPQQLFPSFYNSGPPNSVPQPYAGKWGSYDQIRLQANSGPHSGWTFRSRHQIRGETWCPTEPVPLPLLSPKNPVLCPWTPPDPMDFRKHIQNFSLDNSLDAFGCMAEILGENFNFNQGKPCKDAVKMYGVKNLVDMLKYKICHKTYSSRRLDRYIALLSDVVNTVPPELLGSLLHEELTEQRDRLLFFEGATGGSLDFVPFSESSSGRSERGCLLYPGNPGHDCLNFHSVEMQHQGGSSSFVDASSSDPISFQLKGPVRQISTTSLFNNCYVAVRSDYFCGVWRFSENNEPRLLQVVNTNEVATCVTVSPHVLGEVLVASESGGVKLWTVGRGMQMVRQEVHNLYFNDRSSWRWCEFSAHPRVVLYADRTGVDLTDMRMNPAVGHTLFRISSTPECRRGERVILSRYLREAHSFHNLVTTQYSAFVMDERFPNVPMLKWDHMMRAPPMFCHAIPGSGSGEGGDKTTKVLLGSHSSQEITLLQYSGGRAEACFTRGPPQSLLRPRNSLKHLPVQIPHRHDAAAHRLSSPAAGLTCIQQKGGREAGDDERICVLQLTEAGDIFYHILEHVQAGASPPAEDEPLHQQASKDIPPPTVKDATASGTTAGQRFLPDSGQIVSDTSCDEFTIEPAQDPSAQRSVSDTSEREPLAKKMYPDSSSEDEEAVRKSQTRNRSMLRVLVDDPEPDQLSETAGIAGKNSSHITEVPEGVEENVSHSRNLSPPTTAKISNSALVTWKHWLQKLMRRISKNKPGPHSLQHLTVETKGLLHLSGDEGMDPAEEERVQSLRSDLRACMSQRSLLLQSTVSAPLRALDLVPVPDPVDTDIWTDQLSERLTLSWQGEEEAWRGWWEEHLGLNREEKVEALRKKRRREKEARRASRRYLDQSGSFTSSLSYQSELDHSSDVTGWSSAASQGLGSDTEGTSSQFDGFGDFGTPKAATHSASQMDAEVPTLQSLEEKQGDQQTPRRPHTSYLTQTPKPPSTPSSQRRNKRPAENYLSSLIEPQDEHPQQNGDFLEEGNTAYLTPSTVGSFPSSQIRSFQPVPMRNLRVDLSQESDILSQFSQSLSQSSKGRLGRTPSSQPKKKTRMGF